MSVRGYPWTRKKVAVLVVGCWLVLLVVLIAIPPVYYGKLLYKSTENYNGESYALDVEGAPPVSYKANITLTTIGYYTALNPIGAKVTVYKANVTDLLTYFSSVIFLNASSPAGGASHPGILQLTQTGTGVYTAQGTIVFDTPPAFTAQILVPVNKTPGPGVVPVHVSSLATPAVVKEVQPTAVPYTVGPASLNDSIAKDENNSKVEAAAASAAVLVLEPILEATLITGTSRRRSRRR